MIQEKRCVGCGYNLLSIANTGSCPECGLPCLAYTSGLQQCVSAEALYRAEVGAWLLGVSPFLGLIMCIDDVAIRAVVPGVDVAGVVSGSLITVIWLAGVWLVTMPMVSLEFDKTDAIRAGARYLAIAAAMLSMCAYLLHVGSPVLLPLVLWDASKMAMALDGAAVIAHIVGTVCVVMYMCSISLLSSTRGLSKEIKVHGTIYISVLCASTVHDYAMRFLWVVGGGTVVEDVLEVTMFFIAIAVIAAAIVWARACWCFAKSMRHERRKGTAVAK